MKKRNYASRKKYFDKRRGEMLAFLRGIRKNSKCAKCGWAEHPEILNFHHKDPSKKRFALSKGSVGCYSIGVVMEEVKKCELLCPNCHVWHHFQENILLQEQAL